MLPLLALITLGAVAWLAFTFGRVTADRRIDGNHHRLAMFSMVLRSQDDVLAFLSRSDRKRMDKLIDEYTRLNSEVDEESGRSTIIGTIAMAVAVVIASVLMGACGGATLDEGKVIEKVWDDEDTWYQPGYTIDGGQSCSGGYNGQPRICTDNVDIHIPGQWHTDPERFLLKLEAPDPDDNTKTLSDTRSVPEYFWTDVKVGNWVDIEAMEIVPR